MTKNDSQKRINLLLQQGLTFHNQGNLAMAEQHYRKILNTAPNQADALHLLGVLAQQQGHAVDSIPLIQRALAITPHNATYLINLGNGHLEIGEILQAIDCYKQALTLTPNAPDAYNNLGLAQKALNKLDDAIESFNAAIRLKPDYSQAFNNLGTALKENGQLEQAASSFLRALSLNPLNAMANNNLGLVYLAQLKTDQAIACLNQAITLKPEMFEAHNNLGIAWKQKGNVDKAINSYLQALTLQPKYAEAYFNLGIILQEQKRLEEAVASYQQALTVRPDYPEAYYNLGQALKDNGQLDMAIECLQTALEQKNDYAEALNTLIHLMQQVCDWRNLDELIKQQLEWLHTRPNTRITPFSFLTTPSTAADQRQCAEQWANNTLLPYIKIREQLGFTFPVSTGQKIRLGYLSADFHEHATAYLIAELFELHARDDFEVFAYSYGIDDNSAMRKRLITACDRFIDISHLTDQDAARQINQDNIDILIDLKGYTQNARDHILALRPAPIQINWLGYPGTLGADFVDYIIADDYIIPAGAEIFYSEKVIRLPECYQINDRKRQVSHDTPSRQGCGLPDDAIVFCSFNQTYKILPEMFDVWTDILKQLPGSVLWLLESNRWAVENLRMEARTRGIDPMRIVFAPKRPLADHLARYRLADLCLDTYPVNSHTTASDALWMGCPMVTCSGDSFVSRVAGSLLRAIGLSELITHSLNDYKTCVVDLVRNPEKLNVLRHRLENNRESYPLFDSVRFSRNLEACFKAIWQAKR